MDKNRSPAISVIVPIYNTKDYLGQCIESIQGQTFQNIEIVLVDDGSTDGSGQICNQYAAEDNRIVVIHQKQSGLVAARKKGVACSTGAYISFVDSDDWIDLNMFEILMCEMEQTRVWADVVTCGVKKEFPRYTIQQLDHLRPGLYDEPSLAAMYEHIFFDQYFEEWEILPYMCGKLFSRRLQLYSGQMEVDNDIFRGEDCLGLFQALLKAKSLLVSGIVPYHYRQRNYVDPASTGTSMSDMQIKKLFYGFYKTVRNHTDKKPLMGQVHLIYWNYLLQARHDQLQDEFPDFLIPYPAVSKGARIVLYGAGVLGKSIYFTLKRNPICQVTGWVDQHWDSVGKCDIEVEPVEKLREKEFDYVVICILNERVSESVAGMLCSLGIGRSKIAYIQAKTLQKLSLPSKFVYGQDEL